ncbi:hypothetical protein ACPW96_11795 [Micromonospora sp. DT81.3]|uniref:hypothetical protein n=1 Tax=Micromonospora sp. DT81.3 TaxID=3416523 RepID=UPI003CF86890
MNRDRIAQFRDHLDSPSSDLGSTTRRTVAEVLDLMEVFDDLMAQIATGSDDQGYRVWSTDVENLLNSLRDFLSPASPRESELLRWAQITADLVNDYVRRMAGQMRNTPDEEKRVSDMHDSLRAISDRITMLLDNEALRQEAVALVEQTQDARDAARSAAGVAGSASLATHFAAYAGGERTAANTFRLLTIVAVVGGLAGVLYLGPLDAGDWAGITYRLAIVATAGALAGYFGRQAGQHRRMYNWAKSLEVQLQSFPAFVEPVPAEERGEVYRTFARRVLSAPPEKGMESTEDSVGSAQLLDLLSALAKRSPSP